MNISLQFLSWRDQHLQQILENLSVAPSIATICLKADNESGGRIAHSV
jgi:hypothetical protein